MDTRLTAEYIFMLLRKRKLGLCAGEREREGLRERRWEGEEREGETKKERKKKRSLEKRGLVRNLNKRSWDAEGVNKES